MRQLGLIILSIFLNFSVYALLFALIIPSDFSLLFLLVFPLSSYFTYRLSTTNDRIKKRAIESLEKELSDLMVHQTGLVASAYRSSVSSNSFKTWMGWSRSNFRCSRPRCWCSCQERRWASCRAMQGVSKACW